MATYYRFEPDNYADFGVTKSPRLPVDFSFLSGEFLEAKQLPKLVFEVDFPAGRCLPHYLGGEIPVASQTLIEALQKVGVDNIQVFPALLKNPETGESWKNFLAMNVVGSLAVANMDASEYDSLMEGDPDGVDTPLVAFSEIVLDRKKLSGGPMMFRLAESGDLIVHEKVVDYLGEHRPEGGWGVDVIEVDTK